MNNRLRNTTDVPVRNITIDDIAQALGVSKTTVSRAISGKGRIGPETREKVLSFIEERGYRPNLIAKGLAVSKTFNIAVVLPTDTEIHEMPFFQICLHSITQTVTERDYDVVLSVTTGQNISALRRMIRNQKVDGVILTRLLADDKAVAFLKEEGIPFVVIGSNADDSIIQVDSDQAAGCREVTAHVLETGCRSFVLLAGNPDHQVNKDRYAGFTDALLAAGRRPDAGRVFWGMTTNVWVERTMPSIMGGKADCLVCMDDAICGRALYWLHKNRFRVPEDVRVVSFYDSQAMEQHVPPITALHINVRELGAAAGNALLDLIEGKAVPQRNRVAYELCIRDSSRRDGVRA